MTDEDVIQEVMAEDLDEVEEEGPSKRKAILPSEPVTAPQVLHDYFGHQGQLEGWNNSKQCSKKQRVPSTVGGDNSPSLVCSRNSNQCKFSPCSP